MHSRPIALNKVLLVVLALLSVLSLYSEWHDYYLLWSTSIIYAHGFLILGAIAYLLFRQRNQLTDLPVNISPLACSVVFGLTGVLLVSTFADIQLFRLLTAPLIVVFLGATIWGKAFVRLAAPPVFLIYFAAPIWDELSPLLQQITVWVNQWLLGIFDIPAIIKEFYITIPSGVFYVADGCSGVRYLMVGLFLAAFSGLLFFNSLPRTIVLIVIAAFLSMLANWIRVFGIIYAGHHSQMQSSLVKDHEMFGWVVFVLIMLVPFLYLSRKLEPGSAELSPGTTHVVSSIDGTKSRHWAWPALAVLFVLAIPTVLLVQAGNQGDQYSTWTPTLPEPSTGWSGPLQHADFWSSTFDKPDINVSGLYVSPSLEKVQLQVIGYRDQSQGKELIYYGNKLFDEGEWELIEQTVHQPELSNSTPPSKLLETRLKSRSGQDTMLLWSWYEVGEYREVSRLKVKLLGGIKKFLGDGRGVMWVLATECDTAQGRPCDSQRALLRQFLQTL